MSLLEVNSLSVKDRRSGLEIVQNLQFALEKNSCLGIVGESGSGKSMIAKAILGLTSPWLEVTGEVLFNGMNLIGKPNRLMREIRGQQICLILQDAMTAFNPLNTIGKQMVETFQGNLGLKKRQALEMAKIALQRVHIHQPHQVLQKYPHQLSGGMLQRVMISIAMMMEPVILIADEPTTALDSMNQRSIVDQLKWLRDIKGTSMIFISHDLGIIQYLSDELLIMQGGKCVEYGKTQEVITSPKHAFTNYLISTQMILSQPFMKAMEQEEKQHVYQC